MTPLSSSLRLVVCSTDVPHRDPHPRLTASMMILYSYLAELKKTGMPILHVILLDPALGRADIVERYRKEMEDEKMFQILVIEKKSFYMPRKHSYESLKSIPPPPESLEAIRAFRPDVVWCFEMQAGAIFQDLTIAPKVIQLHDLRFVGMRYHTMYGLSENPWTLLSLPLNMLRWSQWKRYYREALKKFTVIHSAVGSSVTDIRKLGLNVHFVPYAWPRLSGKSQKNHGVPEKPTFLFLGNLSGLGSRSALHFLFQKVYPALVKQWGPKGFHIIICGANKVPPWITKAIAERSELEFRGFVEDIDALMQKCHAVLAPMDVKTGNRSRILTAMSLRVPVVAHENTALGNPSLVHGETCLLSRDGVTFAAHMRLAYERNAAIDAMIERAEWAYEAQYDPPKAATYVVEDFYAAVLQSDDRSYSSPSRVSFPLQLYRMAYKRWMAVWWAIVRAFAVPWVTLEYTALLLRERSALRQAEFLYPLWFWSFGHQASDLHHLALRFPGRRVTVLLSEYGPYNRFFVESFDDRLKICRLRHTHIMRYAVRVLGVARTRALKRSVLQFVLRSMRHNDVALLPDFNLAPGPRISGLFLCEYLQLMAQHAHIKIHPPKEIVQVGERILTSFPALRGRFCTALYLRRKFGTRTDVRDTPPAAYRHAIEHIIAAGGFVFLGGDYEGKDVFPGLEHVLGYADVPCTRAEADAYFLTQAHFVIGGHSGPTAIATVFNTPMLITNNAFFYLSGLRQNQRVLYKRVRDRASKRVLSSEETFCFPTVYYSDTSHFERAGLELLENSPEEIVDATKEMIETYVLHHADHLSSEEADTLQKYRRMLHPASVAYCTPARPALRALHDLRSLLQGK